MHSDNELMNYTDFINIFNYSNQGEYNMWEFDNIAYHRKFPDDDWGLKVLWDTGKEKCEHMNTKKGI